ncbi:MAG: DUF3368 domain-containing protein [Nitrospirae bacterium]|nr:DUF3368 domain-containing protein [Nitrospirota bacterium]
MTGCLISNTGPIIALALIDRLDILQTLFQKVIVPDAVHKELLDGGTSGNGIISYKKASWIRVQSLSAPIDSLLQNVLDKGEASVIQLAREMNADYLLIDERKARKIARDIFGLRVIGTARVLVEAKKKGGLESVGDALNKMRNSGYWIHDDIVQFALKKTNEI